MKQELVELLERHLAEIITELKEYKVDTDRMDIKITVETPNFIYTVK